jgi:anti-sigma regulatory factor (Ser/Thr protein kinase)
VPEAKLRLEIPAQARFLGIAAAFVRTAAAQAGLDEEGTEAVEIASMEAVENVIDHSGVNGNDTVSISIWRSRDDLCIEIRDRGIPWPPDVIAGRIGKDMPPISAERGRGLAMMRALTDRVVLNQHKGGKSLRLVKRLQKVEATGSAAE